MKQYTLSFVWDKEYYFYKAVSSNRSIKARVHKSAFASHGRSAVIVELIKSAPKDTPLTQLIVDSYIELCTKEGFDEAHICKVNKSYVNDETQIDYANKYYPCVIKKLQAYVRNYRLKLRK